MTTIHAEFSATGALLWRLIHSGEQRKSGELPASEADPLVELRQLQLISGAHTVHLAGPTLTDSERDFARKHSWQLV